MRTGKPTILRGILYMLLHTHFHASTKLLLPYNSITVAIQVLGQATKLLEKVSPLPLLSTGHRLLFLSLMAYKQLHKCLRNLLDFNHFSLFKGYSSYFPDCLVLFQLPDETYRIRGQSTP